ncbi:MbnH family di-heme enzyme [Aliikangiella sp. G2MR2-5]|uniref:MbnH family di-heme enzyme n=1 Tax=Aliikangiella sp. G2MR2-5 TaxID=2788943 RepID=UPI0018ABB62B|nr:MbnH family di-heme enzyme [Aliikangiella sp. G2MR2-5]
MSGKYFISAIIILSFQFFLYGCEPKVEKTEFNWQLRDGFPRPQTPVSNPMTNAKVELGRKIFYDKNLSFNQTQSCATCHQQIFAFAENLQTSVGSSGEKIRRNSPALVNIAYNKTLTWAHSGLDTIERQLLIPMFGENPVELGISGHEEIVLSRFKSDEYQKLFESAFPEEDISFELIVKSLASFVRSLVSLDSPFDHYAYDGDDSALSESALRGMNLFFSEKLECHHCHGGFNFTQSTFHEKQILDRKPFHNTGLYNVSVKGDYPAVDNGLYEITLNDSDKGKFRAPTLRNIEVTAPYMHDGSIATLEQVIDFYAAGGRNIDSGNYQGDGRNNPLKSPFIKGFEISEQEKSDLINFLKSLTDQNFLTNKKYSEPVKDSS